MATAKELREQRGVLNKRFQEIVNLAESENRDITAEEDATLKKINEDDAILVNRIKRIDEANARNDELSRAIDLAGENRHVRGNDGADLAEAQNLALNAWARAQFGKPLTDAQVDACRVLGVQPQNDRFAANLSTTEDFNAIKNGLQTKVPGRGGAWTTPTFMGRLESAMLQFGVMLQVAEVITTATGTEMPWPTINDTGNEGVLTSELKDVGETGVNVGAQKFGAHEMTSKVAIVSQAMLDDSDFDIASKISGLFGERLGRGQNRLCTVNEAPNGPRGIVPSAYVGKQTASSTVLTAEEILDLIAAVDPAYRASPTFGLMANEAVWVAMKKLKGSDGHFLWQTSLQAGTPDTFDGKRVFSNPHMSSSFTAGTKIMLAGDYSYYKIRQVRTIYLRRMIEKYATQNADGFVAFLRFDGGLLDAGTHPVQALQMKP